MVDLKAYSAYKDSGVNWLGDIPEQWEAQRLKHVTHRIVGGATPQSDRPDFWGGGVVWLTPTDIVSTERVTSSRRTLTQKGLAACSATLLPKKSVVLTSRAPVGNVALVEVPAATNQGCKGLIVNTDVLSRKYAFRVLTAMKQEIESRATGTTFAEISSDRVSALRIPLPPITQQLAIVRFLDHVDSRLQRFIEVQERLIGLLEEEKQAIACQAVTGGLNPDVPLKPSGVDWLGEIPEHWEILNLGRFIDLLPGFAFPSGGFSSEASDTRLLRGVNVAPGEVRWDEVVRWPVDQQDGLDRYRLSIGDLVLGLDRPVISAGTRVARVTEADTPSLLLQRVARIRTRPGLLPDFAYLLLRGEVFRHYINPIFTGISVPHLSPEQVKKFRIGLPPLSEQEEIVNWVEMDVTRIDAVVTAALRQIALLREFRTRLISDVVTGKLDVRKAAERLPDDPDTADPVLDEQLEKVIA